MKIELANGSAKAWPSTLGPEGRRFESFRPDHGMAWQREARIQRAVARAQRSWRGCACRARRRSRRPPARLDQVSVRATCLAKASKSSSGLPASSQTMPQSIVS
jgi:hypothetical protein